MIERIVAPDALGPDEFDLYARLASRSDVPEVFGIAAKRATEELAPEILQRDANGEYSPDYRGVARVLLERDFDTTALAYYAMQYGVTVASFKQLDTIQTLVAPYQEKRQEAREAYEALLGRTALRYECPVEEVIDLLPVRDKFGIVSSAIAYEQKYLGVLEEYLQKAEPTLHEARSSAQLAARWVAAVEFGWFSEESPSTEETPSDLRWLYDSFDPSLTELQEVRSYVETYFHDESHRQRIAMLAGEPFSP